MLEIEMSLRENMLFSLLLVRAWRSVCMRHMYQPYCFRAGNTFFYWSSFPNFWTKCSGLKKTKIGKMDLFVAHEAIYMHLYAFICIYMHLYAFICTYYFFGLNAKENGTSKWCFPLSLALSCFSRTYVENCDVHMYLPSTYVRVIAPNV